MNSCGQPARNNLSVWGLEVLAKYLTATKDISYEILTGL
jgi:hypothetical protein